jgi:flagellar hook-basal body complex protein FliE
VPNHPRLEGYVSSGERIAGNGFGGTLSSMINHANDLMSKPERLSVEAVHTGKVDIHQVMIALGKSEVAFKLISSITQKTIGALDKLTSMQV